jgi:hypothetical protein
MPLFSQSSLRQTLGSKSLGSNINKALQSATGAKSSAVAKGQLLKSLAGKGEGQRERVYKEFGIGYSSRKQIEGVIGEGKKTYTKNEMVKIRKAEEAKKKLNIFMSKRSAEEGGSGYQESSSSFAGGSVQTRSRVGALDKGKEERGSALAFGQKKIGGFALGSASNSGRGFALGQAKDSQKGFALGGKGAGKDEKGDDNSSKPFIGGLGAGI